MRTTFALVLISFVCVIAACSGGASGGGGGNFVLVEFLESGTDSIPRNRSLTFRFSAPVALAQDYFGRLKIENVQATNFSLAIGSYVVSGEEVVFTPQLPQRSDRGDAGFKANANYHVFLKAGPDALRSTSGARIATPQEFLFDTSDFFEDPIPDQPPRASVLLARDTTGTTTPVDLSRLNADPSVVAGMDSLDLVVAGRIIEPGAGGAPNYTTPWSFELYMSEPMDPATVITDNVSLFEIYRDALEGAGDEPVPTDAASDGYVGNPVSVKVPILVNMVQRPNAQGVLEFFVRVTPVQTLVDDTRYRLVLSGNILGLDFRKTFIGENGLTGAEPQPGGQGYVTEFLVYDRPGITATRTLTYDPLVDQINPERGNTTLDEDLFNSAQYNSAANPSLAVGVLGAFGQGGADLAVTGTSAIDTGDMPNAPIGSPFTVLDIDPNDSYKNTPPPPTPGLRTFVSSEPTIFEFGSDVVSSGATLDIIGVNPCRIVCAGLVQIDGQINASGGTGGDGSSKPGQNSTTNPGLPGSPGPGGFAGGEAKSPVSVFNCSSSNACGSFETYLNCSAVPRAQYPWSLKGEGPGRGNQGGEHYGLDQGQNHNVSTSALTGTGGGGGSHATRGVAGDDRFNTSGAFGTPGACQVNWGVANSSLIGVRGQPGPIYGDREVFDVLMGGSGGGAGGNSHGWYNSAGGVASGGGGGGGGGFLEVIAAGQIIVSGAIDVSGGAGGKGAFISQNGGSWTKVAGSGGGGSGGALSLVSGQGVNLTTAVLDARGGAGGPRPDFAPSITNCSGCNGGGAGGAGFIFLMDPNGVIDGLTLPGPQPGDFDSYATGVLTVRAFDPNRFGGASAVTELFNVRAADPAYLPIADTDIKGKVNNVKQRIRVLVSSARPLAATPLLPDLASEIPAFEVAVILFVGSGTGVDITGNMSALNPDGIPARDAFARVIATFEYDDPVESALGPFSNIDVVTFSFSFNG